MATAQALNNELAERFILGAVLVDGNVMDSMRGTLESEDFGIDRMRRIWQAMCAIYDSGRFVDRVTVCTEMQGREPLSYLIELGEGIPVVESALMTQAAALKEYRLRRRILALAEHTAKRCMAGDGTADEIHSDLAKGIIELTAESTERRPISTREMIDTEGIEALLRPRRSEGLRLPWGKLNSALCGLHRGQMITVAAGTGRGKTSFALQIAAHATRQGKSPMIWALEMSPQQNFARMVNQISHVDGDRARHDAMSPEDRQRRKDAAFWLHGHPVWFDRHSRTVPSFVASVRHAKAKSDVGLVIVDYLQLIRFAGRAESRTREVGENSRALKLAAMDLDVPVMVLSQFKRTDGTKDYTIHDLKESGDIENDSDVILLMNGEQLDGDREISVRVNIGKQREGPTGHDFGLMFHPPSQSFRSVEEG